MPRRNDEKNRPLYMISVAAELAGVHPQTLRIYERKKLICPQRSSGNTRLYSDADVERLRRIHELTQEEGVNLAGVMRILEMERDLERLRRERDSLLRELERAWAEASATTARSRAGSGIVHVRSGRIMRREQG
jgi:MerR family transcriptional regulator/heat shock protein HspR